MSPYTGWTQAHWESVADLLLDAVVPYDVPGFAQYRLPGRPSSSGPTSDGLEGYARTFLPAAFRIVGAGAVAHGVAGASALDRMGSMTHTSSVHSVVSVASVRIMVAVDGVQGVATTEPGPRSTSTST